MELLLPQQILGHIEKLLISSKELDMEKKYVYQNVAIL
jgi:hypothetical protein